MGVGKRTLWDSEHLCPPQRRSNNPHRAPRDAFYFAPQDPLRTVVLGFKGTNWPVGGDFICFGAG